MQRISAEAYQALREALPVLTWNKRPYETLLRTALRESPGLLAELNFADTKRNVADALVDTLIRHEDRYQDVILQLILEISSMTTFPNLEQIKEPDEREMRLNDARSAVTRLRRLSLAHETDIQDAARRSAARDAAAAQAQAQRRFSDDLDALKDRFIELQSATDVYKRGYAFESLLADLFLMFDLEPRLSYNTETDQIDGAFSYDSDDYIVEARWRKEPSSRGDGDIFDKKVQRKGKNALGLFVSISGFSSDLKDAYKVSTSFTTLDGQDLFLILDQRIRLDDALRLKKRHANETGSCFLSISSSLDQ